MFYRTEQLRFNISSNMSLAAGMLSASPCQVSRTGAWMARAKEKVIGNGYLAWRRIAARLAVACSGVWPPERKTTPPMLAGM